jgi:hypothetical protein
LLYFEKREGYHINKTALAIGRAEEAVVMEEADTAGLLGGKGGFGVWLCFGVVAGFFFWYGELTGCEWSVTV